MVFSNGVFPIIFPEGNGFSLVIGLSRLNQFFFQNFFLGESGQNYHTTSDGPFLRPLCAAKPISSRASRIEALQTLQSHPDFPRKKMGFRADSCQYELWLTSSGARRLQWRGVSPSRGLRPDAVARSSEEEYRLEHVFEGW